MNVPKLLAIIVVIAVAAYSLYGTVTNAIPSNLTEPPFDIQLAETPTSLEVDEHMDLVLTLPALTITSKLPQDLAGVKVDVFIGKGDKKMSVGNFDFGTIPGNDTITKDFGVKKIPAVMLMTYMASLDHTDGKVSLPIVINIAFKYMEWQGTQLLDLGISLGVTTEASTGDMNITVEGNSATVQVSPGSSSMIGSAVEAFHTEFGDNATISTAGGEVTVQVTTDSSGNVSVTVTGDGAPAYEKLQQLIDSMPPEGITINFTSDLGTPGSTTITKEQAMSMLSALKTFYEEGE